MLDKYFNYKKHGTDFNTEVRAGAAMKVKLNTGTKKEVSMWIFSLRGATHLF